jgi:acyl-CoA synthetase (AMP-forming)/AMP-acid ligase II
MSRQIKEKLLQVLPSHTKVYIMYGATEAAARLTYVEPERLANKPGSIGIPIPGVTLKILDEEGYYYVIGRKDDLVNVGGHRIHLPEIEDAFMETELLVEVAVTGLEDGLLGGRLVAIAVPVNGNVKEGKFWQSASPGCPDIKSRVKSDWSTRCPRISMVKLIVQGAGCRVQGVAH